MNINKRVKELSEEAKAYAVLLQSTGSNYEQTYMTKFNNLIAKEYLSSTTVGIPVAVTAAMTKIFMENAKEAANAKDAE